MEEDQLIKMGVPPTRHIFLEEKGLTANQLKLYVGLQYMASLVPDIEDGDDANIFTLPEFREDEQPPRWKEIKVTNWKELIAKMGFETGNPQRLKEDLEKYTKVSVPPYPIWINGERYTVTMKGSAIIRTKEVKHDKSGAVREFKIMVGGYTPILKGWWQTISPKFLFYENPVTIPTWKFIVLLGGTIRSQLEVIKNYLKKHHGGLNHWAFVMDLDLLEEKMGIADQSSAYKGKVWKEVYTMLGVEGVRLANMHYFPPKRQITYGLEGFFQEQGQLWSNITGFHPQNRDQQKKWKFQKDALMRKTQNRSDLIGFVLTKKMLWEWLPIASLREGNGKALPAKD